MRLKETFDNEAQFQTQCSWWLTDKGIMNYHREQGRGGRNYSHNTIVFQDKKCAFPDLFIWANRFLFIELKMPGKQMSEEQTNFYEWAARKKEPFFKADCWFDFIRIMNREGVE